MIFRGETIRFDKSNLPPYIFKFNVAMVTFFAAWFALCVPPCIAVGCTFGESSVTYITMGSLFALFFIGLLILYIVALKLRERLVSERAAELEEKFRDIPLDTATEILKERGVINDNGFIASRGDIFGGKVVPFDKAELSVYAAGYEIGVTGHSIKKVTHPLKINIYLGLSDGVDVEDLATYDLDGALFNFLDKRNLIKNYEDNRGFILLKTDKSNFVRYAFGFKLK